MDDTKLTRYSYFLHISSKGAFELLTNLLNWTRLQTGRMKINSEQINLIDLVKEALELHQSNIEKKKLLVTVNYPNELFIFADKNMISTVLRNLISNAVKFTKENGEISITVNRTDKVFIFSIKDSGVGISNEDIKKLFRNDVYFQKHGTDKEMGTGLGLLLVKNFLDLHKGSIKIESEPEKGSTFTIMAPIIYS